MKSVWLQCIDSCCSSKFGCTYILQKKKQTNKQTNKKKQIEFFVVICAIWDELLKTYHLETVTTVSRCASTWRKEVGRLESGAACIKNYFFQKKKSYFISFSNIKHNINQNLLLLELLRSTTLELCHLFQSTHYRFLESHDSAFAKHCAPHDRAKQIFKFKKKKKKKKKKTI